MKRVAFFFFCTVMLFAISGFKVKAATTYSLKVGNMQVTSDNASKITNEYFTSGYCKYNASTNTLTFVNAVINMKDSGFPAVESSMNVLYIEFEGDYNLVSCEASSGFKLKNSRNIYINGKSNSKLTVQLKSTYNKYAAFEIVSGNLTFNQMELYVQDPGKKNIAFFGNNNANVSIQESKMSIHSGNTVYPPFYGFKDISLRSCYADNATLKNGNFYKSDGSLMRGEILYIMPTLSVGRFMVNTESMATYTKDNTPAITTGTLGYDPQGKVLMLNNVIIKSDENYDGISENIQDLTIKLYGQNGITTNTANYAIRANQSMTISGEGADVSSLAFIAQKGIFMLGKTLTVDNANLAIVAGNDAIRGYWGTSYLNLFKCKVSVYTNGNTAIYGFKECTMSECAVIKPEGAYFSTDKNAFVNADESFSTELTIGRCYPVQILGHLVTEENKDDFTCEGLTGSVKYDPDTYTLNLTDVTINSTSTFGILFSDYNDFKIAINGNNNITTSGNAIQSNGHVTFNGSGKLTAKSTEENGLQASADIRLQADAELRFEGKKTGISGNKNNNTYIDYVNTKTDYYVKGEESAYLGGDIVFKDMDFCSNPNYGTPGCYFNKSTHSICQNGGIEVAGDKTVNFYHVSQYYGINIAGTEVNNANRQGVGCPYITNGGGTAVTYMPENNILRLDGVKIEMDAYARRDAKLLNSKKDNLVILVYSDNRLECNGNDLETYDAAVQLSGRNTTIQGSGKLTIANNDKRHSIFANSDGQLTIKDTNLEVAYGIWGNNGDLIINNSTVKVNDGGVGAFNALSLLGGTKITLPQDGAYNNYRVVTPSNEFASYVLFSNGRLKGDVNMDGNVDISDVVAVINTIAGSNTYITTANVNEDSNIDISDVVMIINIIASK